MQAVEAAKARLDAARPTAVNLAWATARVAEVARAYEFRPGATAASLARAVEAEARALAEDDVAVNRALARAGAAVVPRGANILTHCNTGALATVDIGTALGVIYESHAQGKGVHVWVCVCVCVCLCVCVVVGRDEVVERGGGVGCVVV